MKQYTVRYGHIYKLIIAIILPALSIFPFIWLMHMYGPQKEIQQYVIIFVFLGILILFTLWLVLSIYPKALLYIGEKEITLSFIESGFLKPKDLSVKIADITNMSSYKITGNDYILFTAKNPSRKFQLSALSYNSLEYEEFNIAMNEIRELVNAAKENHPTTNL